MTIGITGTRNGSTVAQLDTLRKLLTEFRPAKLLHGACRGVDADAVRIAHGEPTLGRCEIVAYPGVSSRGGENLDRDEWAMAHSNTAMPSATHFARNRDIVNACDRLIAVPPCHPLPAQGGTAYTVGFAIKAGKPVHVIWPGGLVEMM